MSSTVNNGRMKRGSIPIAERQMNDAIAETVRLLRRFATAYEAANGLPIGEDAVIGDNGLARVLSGLRVMLNTCGNVPTDRGELDSMIVALAKAAGIEESDL